MDLDDDDAESEETTREVEVRAMSLLREDEAPDLSDEKGRAPWRRLPLDVGSFVLLAATMDAARGVVASS